MPSDTQSEVPEQRILEASMRLPPGRAVTGWAACRLAGGNFFDGLADDGRTPFPVALAVTGHRVRATPGVCFTYDPLPAWEWHLRHGIPICRPERATHDEMRRVPDVRRAVEVIDMMAAARITSPARVRAYAVAHPGRRRNRMVLVALGLASEHSRSVRETRLRLVAELDAGFPRLVVNCPVYSLDGRLLGVADLIDLEAGLVIEFDGADHRTRRRHTRDVGKDEAFRGRGLEVVRVTGTDLADRELVVSRLRGARRRALFEPPRERRWVARPPVDRLDDELADREWETMEREWWAVQPLPDVSGW